MSANLVDDDSNEESIEEEISIKNTHPDYTDVESISKRSSSISDATSSRSSSQNTQGSDSVDEISKNAHKSSEPSDSKHSSYDGDENSSESEASLPDDDENTSNASTDSDEDLEPMQQLRLTQRKARSLVKNGQMTLSLPEYIRCLALARIIYGDNHWCLAQAHMILAKNYFDLKHYAKQALQHGSLARDIIILWKIPPKSKKKRLKFFYIRVNIYLILGRAQISLEQYSNAFKNLLKAQKYSDQYCQSISDDSKEYIIKSKILTSLAKLNFEKANFEQSVGEYEEAVEFLIKVYGKTALVLVSVRQNLGRSLQRCGKLVEADKEFEAALEIVEKLFGSDSENAIKAELNLAKNYLITRRNSNQNLAEEHLRSVISKAATLNFPKCNSDCEAIDLLVPILISSDRLKEAKCLIESNLSKFVRIFGQTSNRVVQKMSLLGSLSLTLNEPASAAKYFRKCYDRELAIFGISHCRTESTKLALELVCQNPVVPKKFRLSSNINENRPKFIVSRITE